ncbi:MAG: hypothetical protein J7M19_05695 [Planctomycetes bacterium]|nr:hypothetical protein [Planctomycetota bacterium]
MKGKQVALYISVALNAALLVLLSVPGDENRLVLGQVSSNVGAYAAVSSEVSGGNQDALWLADRVSGMLVVYQQRIGTRDKKPFQMMDRRSLRDDLDERQVGNLMMLTAKISSSNSVVCVIDTDSERMAVYEFDRSDRRIKPVQYNNLRVDLGKAGASTR